jgi:hypothetical protein
MSVITLYDKYLKQSTLFSNACQDHSDKHTDLGVDDDEWDTYQDYHRDDHSDWKEGK